VEDGVNAVIVSGVAATTTVTDADCVCTGLPLSCTLAVKVDTPLVVTVPEITPVDGTMDRPAGNCPDEMDHVYGLVPPLACSVWE
jgi:hypothetical protein